MLLGEQCDWVLRVFEIVDGVFQVEIFELFFDVVCQGEFDLCVEVEVFFEVKVFFYFDVFVIDWLLIFCSMM